MPQAKQRLVSKKKICLSEINDYEAGTVPATNWQLTSINDARVGSDLVRWEPLPQECVEAREQARLREAHDYAAGAHYLPTTLHKNKKTYLRQALSPLIVP